VKRLIFLISITLMLVAGVSSSQAQSGGGYDLTWSAINGGGTTLSTGGTYSLGGTIGQADAGSMMGGSYTLAGGFWSGTPAVYRVFLPLTLK
jgi:hypothetical protein